MKPRNWPACEFTITYLEPNQKFHDLSKMPLTSLEFQHEIEKKDNKTQVTHKVVVKGLLAPLLYFTLRPKLKKGLFEAINNLAEMAENQR